MAKLLLITQRVDKDDDVLGVYHRWIEELAKRLEMVYVICLYKGREELPENVKIFSLGKEDGCNRFKYIFRFFKYIWALRKNHEKVLVHMNPIYIILGGVFWKLNRKKIFLWYNHPLGDFMARFGIALADRVFCTSAYSFSAKYKKTEIMPAGIDTDFFIKDSRLIRKYSQLLYLGRISPIKNIHQIIEVGYLLDGENIDFKIMVVGSPGSDSDLKYEKKLKEQAQRLVDSGRVIFKPGVPNHQTPQIYNGSGAFLNLTPTGSLDKTTLEAMACGLMVLASNRSFESFFSSSLKEFCMFKENDPADLARKIKKILKMNDTERFEKEEELRNFVKEKHSLRSLMDKLIKFL